MTTHSTESQSNYLISIITPVYNEEHVILEFHRRITSALQQPFELIFVDDGSTDASWTLISSLVTQHENVRALQLSRNFGHQPALAAGMEHAHGDAIIILDADLQDPPEVIPKMIKQWLAGYDVVYGVRSKRKGESFFKKITATIFYNLFKSTSQLNVPLEAGDFRLMSRKVVDALNAMPEKIRFFRGLTSWVGFRQMGITYSRDQRLAGQTKYSLLKMFRFAFDGITSFSTVPLQFASYLGLLVTSASFLLALHALYVRFVTETAVPGWTSLLITVLFLGGVQLIMVGIIGEYVGRLYQEVKRRPLYLLSKKIGFDESRLTQSIF